MVFARLAAFGGAFALGAAFKNYLSPIDTIANALGVDNPVYREAPLFDAKFRPFKLGEVISLAEDVAIFRFLTINPDDVFALIPCSTLQVMFKNGHMPIDQVSRFYTPITRNGEKGYFDLLVKKQPAGRMTEKLFSMEVGESLYFRVVQYKVSLKPNKYKKIGMIAGGTGITPMYQVIQHVLDNPIDKTELSLLFANRRENNILLRGCLDDYQKKHPKNFAVTYIISDTKNSLNWKGLKGLIDRELIRKTMPSTSMGDDIKVFVCGPDSFMMDVCGAPFGVLKAMSGGTPIQPSGANLMNFSDPEGYLGSLGYSKEQLYRF